MNRRKISMILILAMVLSLIPVNPVYADEAYSSFTQRGINLDEVEIPITIKFIDSKIPYNQSSGFNDSRVLAKSEMTLSANELLDSKGFLRVLGRNGVESVMSFIETGQIKSSTVSGPNYYFGNNVIWAKLREDESVIDVFRTYGDYVRYEGSENAVYVGVIKERAITNVSDRVHPSVDKTILDYFKERVKLVTARDDVTLAIPIFSKDTYFKNPNVFSHNYSDELWYVLNRYPVFVTNEDLEDNEDSILQNYFSLDVADDDLKPMFFEMNESHINAFRIGGINHQDEKEKADLYDWKVRSKNEDGYRSLSILDGVPLLGGKVFKFGFEAREDISEPFITQKGSSIDLSNTSTGYEEMIRMEPDGREKILGYSNKQDNSKDLFYLEPEVWGSISNRYAFNDSNIVDKLNKRAEFKLTRPYIFLGESDHTAIYKRLNDNSKGYFKYGVLPQADLVSVTVSVNGEEDSYELATSNALFDISSGTEVFYKDAKYIFDRYEFTEDSKGIVKIIKYYLNPLVESDNGDDVKEFDSSDVYLKEFKDINWGPVDVKESTYNNDRSGKVFKDESIIKYKEAFNSGKKLKFNWVNTINDDTYEHMSQPGTLYEEFRAGKKYSLVNYREAFKGFNPTIGFGQYAPLLFDEVSVKDISVKGYFNEAFIYEPSAPVALKYARFGDSGYIREVEPYEVDIRNIYSGYHLSKRDLESGNFDERSIPERLNVEFYNRVKEKYSNVRRVFDFTITGSKYFYSDKFNDKTDYGLIDSLNGVKNADITVNFVVDQGSYADDSSVMYRALNNLSNVNVTINNNKNKLVLIDSLSNVNGGKVTINNKVQGATIVVINSFYNTMDLEITGEAYTLENNNNPYSYKFNDTVELLKKEATEFDLDSFLSENKYSVIKGQYTKKSDGPPDDFGYGPTSSELKVDWREFLVNDFSYKVPTADEIKDLIKLEAYFSDDFRFKTLKIVKNFDFQEFPPTLKKVVYNISWFDTDSLVGVNLADIDDFVKSKDSSITSSSVRAVTVKDLFHGYVMPQGTSLEVYKHFLGNKDSFDDIVASEKFQLLTLSYDDGTSADYFIVNNEDGAIQDFKYSGDIIDELEILYLIRFNEGLSLFGSQLGFETIDQVLNTELRGEALNNYKRLDSSVTDEMSFINFRRAVEVLGKHVFRLGIIKKIGLRPEGYKYKPGGMAGDIQILEIDTNWGYTDEYTRLSKGKVNYKIGKISKETLIKHNDLSTLQNPAIERLREAIRTYDNAEYFAYVYDNIFSNFEDVVSLKAAEEGFIGASLSDFIRKGTIYHEKSSIDKSLLVQEAPYGEYFKIPKLVDLDGTERRISSKDFSSLEFLDGYAKSGKKDYENVKNSIGHWKIQTYDDLLVPITLKPEVVADGFDGSVYSISTLLTEKPANIVDFDVTGTPDNRVLKVMFSDDSFTLRKFKDKDNSPKTFDKTDIPPKVTPKPPVVPKPPVKPVDPIKPKDPVVPSTPSPSGGGGGVTPTPTPSKPTKPNKQGKDPSPIEIIEKKKELTLQHSYIKGYPDKNVKKLSNLTRAEAVTIFTRLRGIDKNVFKAFEFKDVPKSSWYYKYLGNAIEDGIVTGYIDGTFKPNQPVRYDEFLAMLYRTITNAGLSSDSREEWSTKYKKALHSIGLVDVNRSNSSYITREDVFNVVHKLFEREFIKKKDGQEKYDVEFNDLDSKDKSYDVIMSGANE